jgi:hypothetical protein
MFRLSRFLGALAAFGMLTLIALAPSAALAHAGHGAHAGHNHSAQSQADTAKADIAKPAPAGERTVQELYSADIVVPHAQHDQGCGDRGCCGSGHCAGCVTALAPSSLAEFCSVATSLRLTFDAAVPPGLGTSGPPRPPKSFV